VTSPVPLSTPAAPSALQKVKNAVNSPMGAAVAGAVGNAVTDVISGGYSTGGVGAAANAVADAVGSINPGLGVLSHGIVGLFNRGFGMKVNQKELDRVKQDTATLNTAASDAASANSMDSAALQGGPTIAFDVNAYNGGWFVGGKAKAKNQALSNRLIAQADTVERTSDNTIGNLADEQLSNELYNSAAYGGPLFSEGGSIHIDPKNKGKFNATKERTGKTTEELTHSSNPLTRKRAIFAQNAAKWKHAFGGELNTQGADFTNGLLYIDAGGSHESNPYEGVPMGVDPEGKPNLVEEGETIFNDYVFSRRLLVPKAIRNKYKLGGVKLTFADASKKLAKESEERPNDPISQRGLVAMMQDLANAQEGMRIEKNDNQYQYAHGGQMGTLYDGVGNTSNYLPDFVNYKWVNGYNGGWYDEGTTNYKDSYLRKVASMQNSDIDRALNNQYAYYMDDANKGTDRWKAIDLFYSKNPAFRTPDVTGRLTNAHYQTLKNLATSGKPGYAHMIFGEATPAKRVIRSWKRNVDGTATQMLGEDKEGGLPLPWEGTNDAGFTFVEDPRYKGSYKEVRRVERPYDTNDNTIYTDVYYDDIPKVEDIGDKPSEDAPKLTMDELGGKSWEGLRYAPIIGQGIFSITDQLSLTNKPDYSNANATLEASKGAGAYDRVSFENVGNYLTYRPHDVNNTINKMNAEAGASRRSLLNTVGGNRGTAMAGILAADNNYLNRIGDLYTQAEDSNFERRQKVEDFNRSTNITNSQGMLQADIANQEARAKSGDLSLKGIMAASELKEKARLASDVSKQANLSGLFTSLGGLGEENKSTNMLKYLISTGTITANDDLLGYLGINVKRKNKGTTNTQENNTAAKGGRLKRKRGLTI
jgi:hypothetical protein